MGHILCPICEKDDRIQKISSIVTSSTIQSTHNSATTATTNLATKLSMPDAPDSFGNVILFVCGVALIPLGAGLFIHTISLLVQQNIKTSELVFNGAGVLICGFFALHCFRQIKQIPVTKRKKMNWATLYYCHRDDCVFDPKTNKHTSPEGMNSLL
jgi:hypothetical protein